MGRLTVIGHALRAIGRPRRPRLLSTLALCAGPALVLAACGSPATGAGEGAVAPPGPPTVKSCGVGGSTPRRRSDRAGRKQRPTPPGVYRYRTHGTSGAPGEAVRAKDLPRVTELIATRSRRFGSLVCFRLQKRYAPDLANTETYIIRGGELFLVGLRLQARGSSQEVRPVPAVLFASNSGSKWSGRFSGATSGSYEVTGLGERTLSLGGRRLKVTGVRSLVSYRGGVSGAQRMTAWVSPRRRLVVLERLAMRERLGVSDVRLRLDRRLVSLKPIRAGGR